MRRRKAPRKQAQKHIEQLDRVSREGVIDDAEGFVRAMDYFSRRMERDPAPAQAAARRFFLRGEKNDPAGECNPEKAHSE